MRKTILLDSSAELKLVSDENVVAETLDDSGKVVNIAEARAVKEEEEDLRDNDADDFIIKSATPLSLSNVKCEAGNVVTLIWLCQSKNDHLFTLATKYIIENELEEERILDIAFHDDNLFINNKIVNNIIQSQYPSYITDFNFSTVNESLKDNDGFKLNAVLLHENEKQVTCTFTVPNDIFISFVFMDNYIAEEATNNYELTMAITGSTVPNEESTKIVVVDKIDSIISMAKAGRCKYTVATAFKVLHGEESSVILAPFNVGVKFPKTKFKGMKVETLEKNYLNDKDQFLNIFIANTRIKNIDKEYLIIKAVNKSKESKLFFLDDSARQQLETMIKEY